MTKAEHIEHWDGQVDDDFAAAEALYNSGHYRQALFWAHLCLEKVCKALWIKTNTSNVPPKIHDLVEIISETNEVFTRDELKVLARMNRFYLKGRYPFDAATASYAKAECEEYLEKTKTMIQCIREKLQ